MALLGARDDQRRPVGASVASVYAASIASTSWPSISIACQPNATRAIAEDVALPPVHGGAALSEPVQVEDRGEAVEPVERRRLHGLPDRALGHLGVAHHHPHVSGRAVEPHGERHPEADREPLAERAGGDVDPRQLGHGRRVALDRRAEPPERTAAPHPRWRRSPSARSTGAGPRGPSTARTGRWPDRRDRRRACADGRRTGPR